MTAVEYVTTLKRMCKYYNRCIDGCPLHEVEGFYCSGIRGDSPSVSVPIVKKWGEEHPSDGVKYKPKVREVPEVDVDRMRYDLRSVEPVCAKDCDVRVIHSVLNDLVDGIEKVLDYLRSEDCMLNHHTATVAREPYKADNYFGTVKVKDKKSGEVLEAIQFTEESKNRSLNWVKDKDKSAYASYDSKNNKILCLDKCGVQIIVKLGMWLLLRGDEFIVYEHTRFIELFELVEV